MAGAGQHSRYQEPFPVVAGRHDTKSDVRTEIGRFENPSQARSGFEPYNLQTETRRVIADYGTASNKMSAGNQKVD